MKSVKRITRKKKTGLFKILELLMKADQEKLNQFLHLYNYLNKYYITVYRTDVLCLLCDVQ